MFGGLRINFNAEANSYKLTLGFIPADTVSTPKKHEGPITQQQITTHVEWSSTDSEHDILAKIKAAAQDPSVFHERVKVDLSGQAKNFFGVVSAASYQQEVQLNLTLESSQPKLRSIELVRTAGNGTLSTSLGLSIWSALDVSNVTRVRCNDGVASLWDEPLLRRFKIIKVLNLSNSGLATLPGLVGTLQNLQELRINGNRLKILPPDLGKLHNLKVLAADRNEISILPAELRNCVNLHELLLAHNRLTNVLINFNNFKHLQVLHLHDNPLEFMPEIYSCLELRNLTVANLRVTSDHAYSKFQVEVSQLPATGATLNIPLFDNKPADKVLPVLALVLRRSSGHHPLLAGSIRYLAEDPKNRDIITRQENALQQLVLMAQDENPVVAGQTCLTLMLLAQHSPVTAKAIVDSDLNSLYRLLDTDDSSLQINILKILAALVTTAPELSPDILDDPLLKSLELLVGSADTLPAVRVSALVTLGSFGFDPTIKQRLSERPSFTRLVRQLAFQPESIATAEISRVRKAALRTLAVLGENEIIRQALGKPQIRGRGVRVLSLDGGGMKGMATVRMLREIDGRTGQRIHELFDLIVGTSTGGLLAVALGINHMTLDECEMIYKVLGQRVFSRPEAGGGRDKEESWMDSFYRSFQNKTQHVRAVVVGCKHDSAAYEILLKEYCDMTKNGRCLSDSMIDTACIRDAPKIALVSSLASSAPAVPFVFRNYEFPVGSETLFSTLRAHKGSSRHLVWQAVRASSAAIYYLDDYTCGVDKFQDGAVTANNPAVVALQEARLLWPDRPIDVFVSIGTGSTPTTTRNRAMSSFMDTGNILIEGATGVHRVEEAMATLLSMVPDVHYIRMNPVDPRCAMELDEIDPRTWGNLEAAVEDYISTHSAKFDTLAELLVSNGNGHGGVEAEMAGGFNPSDMRLSHQRGLFVVRAAISDSDELAHVVGTACGKLPSCIGVFDIPSRTDDEADQSDGDADEGAPAPGNDTALPSAEVATANGASYATRADATASAAATTVVAGAPGGATVEVDIGSISSFISSWFSPARGSGPPASPSAPSPISNPNTPNNMKTKPDAGQQNTPTAHALNLSQYDSLPATPQSANTPLVSGKGVTTTPPDTSKQRSNANQREKPDIIDPVVLLKEKLGTMARGIGILHLAMSASNKNSPQGLVLQWRTKLEAILEPSSEATALLDEIGYPGSLAQLFSAQPEVDLQGGRLCLVSKQVHRIGNKESCLYLMQRTAPAAMLDPQAVASMQGCFVKQLVCCPAVIPADLIAAFLAGGARAVICIRPDVMGTDMSARPVRAFFEELYTALHKNVSVADAVKRAEDAVPGLCGIFAVHALHKAQ